MGIPHRRGYLLFGPPGTGKSTFVHALAGELGFDIAFLSMSAVSGDQHLLSLLARAPANTVLALEDIDAMFPDASVLGPRGGGGGGESIRPAREVWQALC